MTAAEPPMAPDLATGLRRLKLAVLCRLPPNSLFTAKTQRWPPKELLRTLIEAEITAREATNAPGPAQGRGLPGGQDPAGVRPLRVLDPRRDPGLPRLTRMDHRRREPLPGWPGRHRARATCSSRSAPPP
jgi:hypothetical protein